MTEHFDALETRDPAEREAALLAALPAHIAAAQRTAAMGQILAGVDAAQVTSRAALARLPVTRKHELFERQRAGAKAGGDPFGGFSAIGWRTLGLARKAAGAPRARCSPPAFAPATWCTTASATT
jgi:phenylacetate-CoA ligase